MSFREVRCLSKVVQLVCVRPWFQKQSDVTLEPTQETLLPPCRCLLVFFVFNCTATLLSHVQLFVTPWTSAHQASLSISISWSLLKLMSIESLMPSKHLMLCHPLLLLPLIFPRIRVFSKESDLHIRWPKYGRFSFSISPSNVYSGLIFFRIGLISLQSKGLSFLQHHSSKHQFFNIQPSFWFKSLIHA